MRVLILNTDYEAFLQDLYAANPGLVDRSYEVQMAVRSRSLFGCADFYSLGFKANGVEATELHLNNQAMQLRWAAENALPLTKEARGASDSGVAATVRRLFGARKRLLRELAAIPAWAREVMIAQIEAFRPDVILNQAMHFVGAASLRHLVGKRCLLVGQIAAPWHEPADDENYDLMVTSLPNFVSRFRQRGLRVHYNKLGFSTSVLAEVPDAGRDLSVVFVGTLSMHHAERIRLLEYLASSVGLDIWGMGIEEVPESSPLRACYRGHAWGRDMFSIFRRSRVVVNHHIGIAGEFANNMRLYEATGCGAALVTDRKTNLHELFDIGSEVADYGDPAECRAQIESLVGDAERCANVGRSGQARTCRDHTYLQRAAELAAAFAEAAR